jgi:hypothetical protein
MHLLISFVGVVLFATFTTSQNICNLYCDDRDSSQVSEGARVVDTSSINGRDVKLIISDMDNMAFATIENGTPRDEVWLDRSFDGGISWDDGALLGFKLIPDGDTSTSTNMFNVDHDAVKGLGSFRACGRGLVGNGPITCTEWARSSVHAETPIEAAATALMQFYNGQLFTTVFKSLYRN